MGDPRDPYTIAVINSAVDRAEMFMRQRDEATARVEAAEAERDALRAERDLSKLGPAYVCMRCDTAEFQKTFPEGW